MSNRQKFEGILFLLNADEQDSDNGIPGIGQTRFVLNSSAS
jgi:hypothetical protein